MVNIGIVGLGFMGYTHFTAAQRLRGGKVTAIATRDAKKRAGDWTSIQGNFGPRGGKVDLSKVRAYGDHRELLNDPDVDLVDICLPTDLHEKVVGEAITAGKHVLVEKPIAVDLKAADRMVKAAERAGVLLMVGHVLPFFPEFRFALETVQSGKHGKLLGAHFRRVICPPDWSGGMSDFRKLGGWGIDLHIHDNHFIALMCGRPKQVFARGLLVDGYVNHVQSSYVFNGAGPAVTCVSGGIAAKGHQFAHAYEIYLEKATLMFSAGTIGGEGVVDRPLTVITQDGKTREVKPKGGEEWCAAFTAELQSAVKGVKDKQVSPILSGVLARDALKLCYAEAKSIATGKPVAV
jgi:predicted dehydrogenase